MSAKYEHSVSDESLNVIEQECEYRVGDLATARFRRLFNEIDALRAEVAALKAELTELRALRDRLVKPLIRDGLENYGRIADSSGEDDMEFEGELFRIIARAQELAG